MLQVVAWNCASLLPLHVLCLHKAHRIAILPHACTLQEEDKEEEKEPATEASEEGEVKDEAKAAHDAGAQHCKSGLCALSCLMQ